MKPIQQVLNYTEAKRSCPDCGRNCRGINCVETLFWDRINKLRKEAGYKPLPFFVIKKHLSNLATYEKRAFLTRCNEAKNFTAHYHWQIKEWKLSTD